MLKKLSTFLAFALIAAPSLLQIAAGQISPYEVRADWSAGSMQRTSSKKETSWTVLKTSLNPSVAGQGITLGATVSGQASTPTGTVQFYDGGTLLGTGYLDANGFASVRISTLPAGTHPITVSYGGDSNHWKSTSATLYQVVNTAPVAASTSTQLLTSFNPIAAGQAVMFSVTVSSAAGTPTGSVQFLDGTTVIGTGVLSGGSVSYTTSSLAAGTHPITARYSGDSNFSASTSQVLQQTITSTSQATSVTLLTSANPVPAGQAVTFRATVAPASGTGTPTGSVQFLDGTTAIGSGVLSSGIASFTVSSLAAGTHPITARYSGDSNFSASTSQGLQQTITSTSQATSVTLLTSANPVPAGQAVTFRATVAPAGGTGTPTGSVQFLDGTTAIGNGVLSSGIVSFTISSLAAGTHPITARYSGDSNFSTSTSQALQQTISSTSQATSVTLLTSANPVPAGQAVTFRATVAPASGTGTPTGSVQFLDGTTAIGSGALSSGIVSFTISSLSAGTHPITARYSGDSNFSASTSQVLQQTMGASSQATSVTLITSANPALTGQTVTFQATVTAGSGTPSGTVQFMDGTTLLGSSTLANGTASFAATLAAGTHSVKALYGGDASYQSSSSAILSQVVSSTTTRKVSLSWVASPSLSVAGYNVYRATVSGGPYTKVNPSAITASTYTDTSVQAGQTYYYVCTAVDTSATESTYSNQATATVPTP